MPRPLTVAFLVLALCLLAVTLAAQPVPASPPVALPHGLVALSAEAEGEGEWEEVEGELEGEEAEEGEEFEIAGDTAYLPAECLLRSVEPTVVAQGENVHLTVRYSADSAAKVDLSYWLKGGKGSLQLGSTAGRIGRHGTLRANRHLTEREAAKVAAAHAFVVDVDVPAASAECRRYLMLRLTTHRLRGKSQVWSE
jgi:hypothetical protein